MPCALIACKKEQMLLDGLIQNAGLDLENLLPFPLSTAVLFVFLKKALQIPLLNQCDLQRHAGEQQRWSHVSYFRKAGCIYELHTHTHRNRCKQNDKCVRRL